LRGDPSAKDALSARAPIRECQCCIFELTCNKVAVYI
jgi:hypothetical protein